MTKNLLTFLSHNFCVNCCGDEKKLDCDSRGKTCARLASFLMSCKIYKEYIDEKKLNKLANEYCPFHDNDNLETAYFMGFKAGYRKAKEI